MDIVSNKLMDVFDIRVSRLQRNFPNVTDFRKNEINDL